MRGRKAVPEIGFTVLDEAELRAHGEGCVGVVLGAGAAQLGISPDGDYAVGASALLAPVFRALNRRVSLNPEGNAAEVGRAIRGCKIRLIVHVDALELDVQKAVRIAGLVSTAPRAEPEPEPEPGS